MNKIYQKSFPDVKNAFRRVYGAIEDKFSVPAAKVISQVTVHVIPEGCSRESQPCKTAKRLGLPTETLGNDGVCGKQLRPPIKTFGGDGVCAKQPGLPDPAGRQTRGHDGRHQKRAYAAGFTLIELLVVVLIISILSAIALPQYRVAVAKSRAATVLPLLRALKDAEVRYYLANGEYAADLSLLDIDLPAGGTFSDNNQTVTWDGWHINLCTFCGYSIRAWPDPSVPFYIEFYPEMGRYPARLVCWANKTSVLAQRVCASFGSGAHADDTNTGYDMI